MFFLYYEVPFKERGNKNPQRGYPFLRPLGGNNPLRKQDRLGEKGRGYRPFGGFQKDRQPREEKNKGGTPQAVRRQKNRPTCGWGPKGNRF